MDKHLAKVYVALGSNLNSPVKQLKLALKALEELSAKPVIHSTFYQSKPLGPTGQPDYLNAVALIHTDKQPHAVLHCLQEIEDNQGRDRTTERWGPRTLDLDLLLYDQLVLDTPSLTIPHKEMLKRNFVLHPLFEIAPKLILPGETDIKSALNKLAQADLDSGLQTSHPFNPY